MGASSSKTVTNPAASGIPGVPGSRVQTANAKLVKEAVEKGDQILLEKDVRDKISEVSDIFSAFNKDDHKKLLGYVDSINQSLKMSGNPTFELSEPIKKSLVEFHTAILSGIDTATMTEEGKNAKYLEIMSSPVGDKVKNIESIFKILGDNYGKDLEEKKKIIMQSQGIVDSKEMQGNVETIMNSVKGLKVKYKFFEYKYIELNIFLILFVQQVYKSMDSFVNNVVAFNKQRDATREQLIRDTLKIMLGILTAADLQINPNDFEYLTGMMDKLKSHMDDKNKELETKMRDLVAITTDNLSGFLGALTEPTKIDLMKQLQQDPKLQQAAQAQGVLRGGFVRDGSMFPQAFYDLDKVDLPPTVADS